MQSLITSRDLALAVKKYGNSSMGVIYGEYEGYRYPHFLDWEVQYPSLFRTKVKNLLSLAVNRSDLRRINYNKTVFGRGSTPDPAGRVRDALPDPSVRWGGTFPPHSPLLSPRDPRAPRSPSEPLFRSKLRPWTPVIQCTILATYRRIHKLAEWRRDTCRSATELVTPLVETYGFCDWRYLA